jgi:hypothetical protein
VHATDDPLFFTDWQADLRPFGEQEHHFLDKLKDGIGIWYNKGTISPVLTHV